MRSRFAPIAIAMVAMTAPSSDADDAQPEIAIIINDANREAPNAADLESMFLKKDKFWGNHDPVVVISAPPESGLRHEFVRVVLGMSPDEDVRYWLDLRIRSGDSAPKVIADPGLTVRLVGKMKGALAYVPATTTLTGVRVIRKIRRGKLVSP